MIVIITVLVMVVGVKCNQYTVWQREREKKSGKKLKEKEEREKVLSFF